MWIEINLTIEECGSWFQSIDTYRVWHYFIHPGAAPVYFHFVQSLFKLNLIVFNTILYFNGSVLLVKFYTDFLLTHPCSPKNLNLTPHSQYKYSFKSTEVVDPDLLSPFKNPLILGTWGGKYLFHIFCGTLLLVTIKTSFTSVNAFPQPMTIKLDLSPHHLYL